MRHFEDRLIVHMYIYVCIFWFTLERYSSWGTNPRQYKLGLGFIIIFQDITGEIIKFIRLVSCLLNQSVVARMKPCIQDECTF